MLLIEMSREQNAIARTPYVTLQNIDEDDVEDGVVTLKLQNDFVEDREVVAFIERYTAATEGFHDYFLHSLKDVFATRASAVSSTLWVENPLTGAFTAVRAAETSVSSSSPAAAQVASSAMAGKGVLDARKAQDDDRQLESVPSLPKLTEGERGSGREKTLSVPPFASHLRYTDEEARRDQWTQVRMEYRNFSFVKRLLFLFFQGLLAGFCVVTLFSQSSASSEFFVSYQSTAQEVRRYFFLLSTISLVGSIDYLITLIDFYTARNPFLQDTGSQLLQSLEEHQKFTIISALVILVLHVIVFLCVLVMSTFDVQTAYKDGQPEDTWVVFAKNDSQFMNGFDRWVVLNNARVFASLVAWIGCCILLWKDFSRFSKLWLSLKRVRRTALSWMKRAHALEGSEEIDKLPASELQEIIKVMEGGLQRARHVLSFQQQEDLKKFP